MWQKHNPIQFSTTFSYLSTNEIQVTVWYFDQIFFLKTYAQKKLCFRIQTIFAFEIFPSLFQCVEHSWHCFRKLLILSACQSITLYVTGTLQLCRNPIHDSYSCDCYERYSGKKCICLYPVKRAICQGKEMHWIKSLSILYLWLWTLSTILTTWSSQ